MKILISLLGLCAVTITGGLIFDATGTGIMRGVAVVYFLGTGALIVRNCTGISWVRALLCAPLALVSFIGGIGGIIYFFFDLSLPIVILLLWLVLAATLLSARLGNHTALEPSSPQPSLPLRPHTLLFSSLYVLCIIAFLAGLYFLQTTDAVLGPWDGVGPIMFVLFFFSSFLLVVLLWIGIPSALSLLLLILHTTTSLSVALIRFPLSFGFDPIIHHAAEKLVLEHGSVLPKTFYYLAQYAVIPFFARIFDLSVASVHQPLTLIVIGLSLPVLLVTALTRYVKNPLLVALCFFIIPFPHLVMTTPWGLAYGTTILTLLSSGFAAQTRNRRHWILVGALALFTLMLHPLAGIPLLFFLAILATSIARRHLMTAGVFVLGAVSIPLAFIANAFISPQFHLSLSLPTIHDLIQIIRLEGTLQTRFSPLLDATYAAHYHGHLVLLILALIGIILAKMAEIRSQPFFRACLFSALFIAITGILTGSLLRIDSIAGFEQQDYAKRLFEAAALFLLPLAAITLDTLLSRIRDGTPIIRLVTLLGLAGLLTAGLYLSYPRNDVYVPSHAYTLSQTDINAVHAIDADAGGRDYAVLSNQVVASAAIREFGFARYFNVPAYGEVFYYPVPSGSPLAEQYYAMLRAPSRETAARAMDIVGVDRIYFVVRDYEFRFPIIVRDGKATADEWREIDSEKAVVFTYSR
ncbi:hypothetical protein HY623_00455 [Candidatus Uhrbacteria bacterium]|nr:hypothetical protein [Candidatus Uhrbacteria bacterium]